MEDDQTTRRPLAPHPELWRALGGGAGLRAILTLFYERVYRDARLSPFFAATSVEWAIDHQYAFLRQLMTGDEVFFGDRPRNAHHWMVISDELFDYREALFAQCLGECGISSLWARELREIHERFRHHIVKDAPFAKKRGGVALPLDGHERVVLSVGACCDACSGAVEQGESAWAHVRTGRTMCGRCAVSSGLTKSGER